MTKNKSKRYLRRRNKEKIGDSDWNESLIQNKLQYHLVTIDVEEELKKKEISINFSYPAASSLHWKCKLFDSPSIRNFSLPPFKLYLHRRRKTRKIVKNCTMPRDKWSVSEEHGINPSRLIRENKRGADRGLKNEKRKNEKSKDRKRERQKERERNGDGPCGVRASELHQALRRVMNKGWSSCVATHIRRRCPRIHTNSAEFKLDCMPVNE